MVYAPRKIAAVVTANGALVAGKQTPVDASGGPRTMTLPTGASDGASLSVTKTDATANAVSVTGSIRGVANQTITLTTQYELLSFVADATGSWWPESGHRTLTALSATFASYKNLARNPDLIITGAVTRDANGAATSAPVTWPDGTPGTYTADTVSTAFPGAVDAYHITYGSPVTKTYTQPAITRDATSGAATNVPAIQVA